MNTSPHSIDPAPYLVISGAVEVADTAHPADITDRLHTLLSKERFLAAVDHRPNPDPNEAIAFTLACDLKLRVLHVDEHGDIRPGKHYADVERELSERLGQPVSLWVDPELLNDGQGDEEYDESQDADLRNVEDIPDELAEAESENLPEYDPAAFEDEQPSRVLVFSHRGVSNGFAFLWTAKTDQVEAGIENNWSVFRFLDKHSIAEIPDASHKELPSIRVVFTEGETNGWAYVNIATHNAKGMNAHLIYPTSAAYSRPVIDPDELSESSARLLSVLVNDHLAHDSQANHLIADDSIEVAAEAFHAALAPQFTGTTLDRLEAILISLHIPANLVTAAVRGLELPNSRTYARRSLWRGLAQIGVDGVAGASALGRKGGFFRRLDDYLRARPFAAYAFSLVEFILGALAVALSLRHFTGMSKWLVVAVGSVVVIDAVLDVILTTFRVRKNRPRS